MFAAFAMSLMLGGGWTIVEALGVRPMALPWADARTITGAGLALEQGLDPLVTNPGDPWGRVMNYPRPWLALAKVGFRPEHTWILAWTFFASLLVGLVILRPLARDRATSYFLLLSIFAPTTWLAIERANNDVFVFGLACSIAYLSALRPVLASILIATAALLKVYPIVALVAHLREKPHTGLKYAMPLLLLFAAYVLATWNDLRLIQAGTLRAPWLAYGIEIAPSIIAKNSPIPLSLALWIAAFSLLIACTIGYGLRLKVRLGAAGTPFSLAAFRIGSAIYLGSFLIGSSFDYRLMFLILTIPQLVAWVQNAASGPRQLALSQLVIAILLQWSQSWRAGMANTTGSGSYGLVIDELLTWLCWVGLAVLMLLTLPDWLVLRSKRGLAHADAEQPPVMTNDGCVS
jgi:hypothetical protein